MVKLITPVSLPNYPRRICYRDRLLFLGSCFSRHIGDFLVDMAFPSLVNPFGVLYNPLSVAKAIERIANPEFFDASELFPFEGRWHSYMHHSSLSRSSIEETLLEINGRLSSAAALWPSCSWLVVTFGSARVYRLREGGEVVTNCHKQPDRLFLRQDIPLSELIDCWEPLTRQLLGNYPQLNILLTVSPIRHLGDGMHANAVSKAKLLLLCEKLCEMAPDRIFYFPAYEIMMDELRDYRYYADDLKHPSELAVQVIRERFVEALIEPQEKTAMAQIGKLQQLRRHRLLNPSEEAAAEWREKIRLLEEQIRIDYPYIEV
ncbi:MAG: GSCFA domain-containing protein [Porphyromonas sp.]|nr:GSCFA domain-containing protein [Porphyromonas sp.]